MNNSLTLIVPALNEEKHVANTVLDIDLALKGIIEDYEILIFNDGSKDRTGEIAEELKKTRNNLEVIHHKTPQGLGASYKEGVRLANKSHVFLVPGDNELHQDSIRAVCEQLGTADIILTYGLNPEVRPYTRQLISRFFAWVIRVAANLDVRYFNGPTLHRTDLVRIALSEASDGFAYQAEILARMIKSGATYTEVGMYLNPRPETSAFRMANIFSVGINTLKLFYKLRWHCLPLTLPNLNTPVQTTDHLTNIV